MSQRVAAYVGLLFAIILAKLVLAESGDAMGAGCLFLLYLILSQLITITEKLTARIEAATEEANRCSSSQ